MRKKSKTCALCSADQLLPIVTLPDSIWKVMLERCEHCGAVFQNPLPTDAMLQQLYSDIYTGKLDLPSTENAYSIKDEIQEKGRIMEIEKCITGGKLLDVGASTGFFLSELAKKKQWEVLGVEYDKRAAAMARKQFGLPVLHGGISHKELRNAYYDVVTMHSVLEHIPDVQQTVHEVNKKLKKGGYYIFNVPNIQSFEYYLYSLLGRRFPGFIVEHLYYFTPRALKILLEKNGFQVKKITSRHHSSLRMPPRRPLLGWCTFPPKLFLEYTDRGGALNKGNVLYVYAQKYK